MTYQTLTSLGLLVPRNKEKEVRKYRQKIQIKIFWIILRGEFVDNWEDILRSVVRSSLIGFAAYGFLTLFVPMPGFWAILLPVLILLALAIYQLCSLVDDVGYYYNRLLARAILKLENHYDLFEYEFSGLLWHCKKLTELMEFEFRNGQNGLFNRLLMDEDGTAEKMVARYYKPGIEKEHYYSTLKKEEIGYVFKKVAKKMPLLTPHEIKVFSLLLATLSGIALAAAALCLVSKLITLAFVPVLLFLLFRWHMRTGRFEDEVEDYVIGYFTGLKRMYFDNEKFLELVSGTNRYEEEVLKMAYRDAKNGEYMGRREIMEGMRKYAR